MTIEEQPLSSTSGSELSLSDRWDRIHFHFFPVREVQSFLSKWGNLSVAHTRPEIVEVADGLINNLEPEFTLKNNLIIGVRNKNDQPVEASCLRRVNSGERQTGKEECKRGHVLQDCRTAYYLGVKAKHYGHFLLDTLCRAWAWEECGHGAVPVIQVSPIKKIPQSIYAQIPNLMERIEIVLAPTRYDNVIVPSPAFVIGQGAHIQFKAMCERIAERSDSSTGPMTEQPLYLSRAGLGAEAKRHFPDELQLEGFLEREGFRIVRPEALPFAEQVALFNSHKWIVAPQGSACHTRLFSRRPVNLLVLTSTLKPNYILCDLLCEGASHYGKVLTTLDFETGPNSRLKRPVKSHNENLLALLKQFGLVRETAVFPDSPADAVTPSIRSTPYWSAPQK
jgi:hypothetical protein